MKIKQYFINTDSCEVIEKRRYARLCDGEKPWCVEINLSHETKDNPNCMGITIDYESIKKFVEKVEKQKAKDVA